MTEPTRLVTIREAAAIVSVSRRTIYKWIADGKLQTCRTASGMQRIDPDSLWRIPPEEAEDDADTP